jgi:hypothetical protein
MPDSRRSARQAVARAENEKYLSSQGAISGEIVVACECGWLDCDETLVLEPSALDTLRRHAREAFVALPAHADSSRILARHEHYVLVAGWYAA